MDIKPKKKLTLREQKLQKIFEVPTDERIPDTPHQFGQCQIGQSVWGGKRIEVPYFEEIKNEFPLPDGPVFGVIVGGSGEGKTFILLSLIPLFHELSQIMICSCIVGNEVYDAIESYCHDNGLEYGNESQPEPAKKMIQSFINKKKEGTWSLIIFDDFNQGYQSRSNPYNNIQINVFQKLRNYSNHAIVLTQDYTNVPTLARNNMNLLITFRLNNKYGVWAVAKDFSNLSKQSQSTFMLLYRKADKKHSFILVRGQEIYIYIPETTDGLEKVDVQSLTQQIDLDADVYLSQLIELCADDSSTKNLRALSNYIKKTAKLQQIDLPSLVHQINQKFETNICV